MGQGAYIFGCHGTRLSVQETDFFRTSDPWGFILFARNVVSGDQLRALTGDLRDAVGRDAPILIDQEGGRVQRLGAPVWRQWQPPMDMVQAAGADAGRAMWLRYRLIAHELRDVGIDVNCAPMADIAGPDTHPFLANRCYGTDAGTVAEIARSVADGLLAGGVLPVLKHIPGHGRAAHDSHLTTPVVSAGADDLFAMDFAPFTALSDLAMGMTAHVVYDQIDASVATTSAVVIRLIRDGIGFGGLLMSDDLSMGALAGTAPARASAALYAGCDLVLHCSGDMAEMAQIADTCGPLSTLGQMRAEAALLLRKQPDPIDIDAAEDEIHALTQGAAYV